MTTHMSLRLAWHQDGWNGHICKDPKANPYCAGPHSYPGDLISQERNLDWEAQHGGESCLEVLDHQNTIPPCCYSMNAFGKGDAYAKAKPPEFFDDDTQVKEWRMPPASATIWPYEAMYKGDVKTRRGTYDYEKRLEAARQYFLPLEEGRTLIFYYANFSNPFSENDQNRYALIGMSRLKEIGEELFYEGCSKETKRKFAGGFVWQRRITSEYPEEGFRIPYHRHMDDPDSLEKITLIPENPRNFKYGSRQMTDDDALELVETFLETAGSLIEIGDTSEDWEQRKNWLTSVVAELWNSRGLYPGLLRVLDILGFQEAMRFFKDSVNRDPDSESSLKDQLFEFLREKGDVNGLKLTDDQKHMALRRW